MDDIEPIIKVDEKQSQEMVKSRWFDSETPFIMIPIEYRIKAKDVFSSGFFMFTEGSLYIFVKKLFTAQNLFKKLHLLNCKTMLINTSSISLNFINSDEHSKEKQFFIEIKSEHSIKISQIMIRVFHELTLNVPDQNFFEIKLGESVNKSILKQTEVNQRSNCILTMRTIFFCHFYNSQKDEAITNIPQFENYDKSPHDFIAINSKLMVGQYAAAFGHSLAWEPLLSLVIFENYNASNFDVFLKTLIEKSIFCKSIAFVEYSSDTRVYFNFSSIKTMNIKTWTFLRNSPQFMIYWAQYASDLMDGIETIHFGNIRFSTVQECITFFDKICRLKSLSTLTTVHFSYFNVRPFPFDSLLRFITSTEKLESVIFSAMDVDATQILKILCRPLSVLTHICLTRMQFRTVIDNKDELANLLLPPNLLYINVSGSFFTPSSFKFLLSFLNKDLLAVPIHFEANEIEVRQSAYEFLSTIAFDRLYPNLREVTWCANIMPANWCRYFFAFLFTQKRLKFLSLKRIKCEDPITFLKYVIQLIYTMKLPGIDICSNMFDKDVFIQFIEALANANFLKRIGLANADLNNQGLKVFSNVINNLSELTEITADGSNPHSLNSFLSFYDSVLGHPRIVGIDKPSSDYMKLKEQHLISRDERENMELTLGTIRKMSSASTPLQRSYYIKSLIANDTMNDNVNAFIGKDQICQNNQCLLYLESLFQ